MASLTKISRSDNWKVSLKILKQSLILHEGFDPVPRQDRGGWVVGHGHWSNHFPDVRTDITTDQANIWLRQDIGVAVQDFLYFFPEHQEVDPIRTAVVIEFLFTLGRNRAAIFEKFLVAFQKGNYKLAAWEMISGTSKNGRSLWFYHIGEKRALHLALEMVLGKNL